NALTLPYIVVLVRRSRSLSQKHVNCSASTVATASGGVRDHLAAHSPCTQPALDVLLQHGLILVRMPAPAMDNTYAPQAPSHRLQQKLFKYETCFLLIEPMQIQVRLD